MNKRELIERLAWATGINYKTAKIVLETTLESMTRILAAGGRVEIRGFGSITIRDYEPYVARNPKTGELIDVEARKIPSFKAGKALRGRVNSNEGAS